MTVATAQRRGNLPADLTSFVGRRQQTTQARRLLSRSRLVTLTGVGGVGKTRLALRVADEVRRAFPDGVWLVDLSAVADPGLLCRAVATAVGMVDRSTQPPEQWLREYLADRRMLLVMDNCEHLVDGCAALVSTLLAESPGLRVLATSRAPLDIAGEHVLAVPPLTVPRQALPTDELRQYEAVELFERRAAAAVPGFGLDEGNCRDVTVLCQRLDGLPLAIELAAVRIRALSVEQITRRLDDRFRVLALGGTQLPRQQTLRATMDWSFELCSPPERTLWARLSVFAGGFSLEDAEQVCSGPGIPDDEVFPLVSGLVEKSIVVREDCDGRAWFRLLETIRQYGRGRLVDAGEEDAVRRRHRDHFQRLCARAEAEMLAAAPPRGADPIRGALPNLRAALEFCLSEPGEADTGLAMAAALWSHRLNWVSLGEGRRWLERGLALAARSSPARAKALWVAAWLAVLQGDDEAAVRLLDEADTAARRVGDATAAARVVQIRGVDALLHGEFRRSLTLLEDALRRLRAAADGNGEWFALYQLTQAASVLGDGERAARYGAECLRRAEATGASPCHAAALWALGLEQQRLGATDRAGSLVREALRLHVDCDNRWGVAQCVETLAWIAAAEGIPERAASLLGAAASLWRSLGVALSRLGHLRGGHAACDAAVREELGEPAFVAAFRRGGELSEENGVREALGELPDRVEAGGEPAAPGGSGVPLTEREWQVARLIAQGRSNRQIAELLVVARRTAEAHVEHILSKLGFASRAQVAAWVAEVDQAPPRRLP
ncbi:ATP-binding protein [Gandjariella thermophila]|uniref:LuxR family transcriptional regulator n=1 Tax=Gandjariella thermophila TaxID=1931992 RepID=A0A4D4J051_9PSEU|nr:LuxR C-terminal-related transcriptional regulator [Gandjariella thermophila]GDY28530.1 LuxR family transcriptional regulator [Gandjariella thermophila]